MLRRVNVVMVVVFLLLVEGSGIRGGKDKLEECSSEYARALMETSGLGGVGKQAELIPKTTIKAVSHRPVILHLSPGTTATRSLAQELGELGVTVMHWQVCYGPKCPMCLEIGAVSKWSELEKKLHTMMPVEVWNWFQENEPLFQCFDAFSDSPVARLSWLLPQMYPNALVLLTDRDSRQWLKARRHFDQSIPVLFDALHVHPLPDSVLPLRGHSDEDLLVLYDALRQYLLCVIPPERLLRIHYFIHPDKKRLSYLNTLADFLTAHNFPIHPHWRLTNFIFGPGFLLLVAGCFFLWFVRKSSWSPFRSWFSSKVDSRLA